MKTVIIDPGHGGVDFGAINGTRYEKNDNLRLGLAVRDKLNQQQGIKTIMTRDTDIFIPLSERSAISNYNNADMFVSLHRNASVNPAANGVENFVYTIPSAAAVNYATNVLNKILNVGVQNNRGVKREDFSVLRQTKAPAQLLELGFISNEVDNIYFDRYFDAYATAIVRGIMESMGLPYTTPGASGRSETIKSIQSTLNSRYGTGLTIDGIYGPNTRRALVRGLQTELNRQYNAGLTVDGALGPATRAAIRNVSSGAYGNIAYILQAALFANGFNPGLLDGAFGRMTGEALREFQASRGLTSDGIAGPATFAALLS